MPETDSTARVKHAWVIYNGPSRFCCDFTDFEVIVGCNFIYRDLSVTDLVAADRLTVSAIRRELDDHYAFRCWTRQSSLELPPGWQHLPSPGIDSGSLAVAVALDRAEHIWVTGCDGICGGSRDTAYLYPWHAKSRTRNIHLKHLEALKNLTRAHPGRIRVIWPQPVSGLETVDIQEARHILGK